MVLARGPLASQSSRALTQKRNSTRWCGMRCRAISKRGAGRRSFDCTSSAKQSSLREATEGYIGCRACKAAGQVWLQGHSSDRQPRAADAKSPNRRRLARYPSVPLPQGGDLFTEKGVVFRDTFGNISKPDSIHRPSLRAVDGSHRDLRVVVNNLQQRGGGTRGSATILFPILQGLHADTD